MQVQNRGGENNAYYSYRAILTPCSFLVGEQMGGENRPVCNGKTIDYPGFYRGCFCPGENILDRHKIELIAGFSMDTRHQITA